MLGSATKSFADIVMSGEMIENAIRCGKIEIGESMRRLVPKKMENEVGNVSLGYPKSITISQSRAVAAGQQAPPRQEPNTRQNVEKFQFTLIPVTYRELYKTLFDAHAVAPVYSEPLQPPYPKWYDANTQCEYHAGIVGHPIENCFPFKKLVERLIQIGIVKLNDAPVVGNPLRKHIDNGVNAIIESAEKRIKLNVAEIRTPLRECSEFRALVQGLMDNKELEFFDSTEGENVCTFEGESVEKDVEAKWGSRTFPCIFNAFVSEEIFHPGSENMNEEMAEDRLKTVSINAVLEKGSKERNLASIYPYEPGSVLNNWTMKEIPVVFRPSTKTSTGATPFSLVYGMDAVLPIEVEIPYLQILSELKLDEAEWVQSQYDQLNLIEENG
ncbi:hypothetical protein EPI10_024951 [Gossypium australe]|uniref:Uncharacterized protein n=1 Tax=Gossypium australe TaxID=47621 RepID=A0A5B6W085_9ROSI|nr:hypothetical protein EPI10_024951 [Gossypium australe]